MKQEVSFQYEGRSYKVNVERIGNKLVIENDGQFYEVLLTGHDPIVDSPPLSQGVKNTDEPANVEAYARTRSSGNAEPGDVVAPMTGTIRDVRVQVGGSVVEGEILFVMEAMKMDLEIPAATSGSVIEIPVREGDSVVEAQLLARVAG